MNSDEILSKIRGTVLGWIAEKVAEAKADTKGLGRWVFLTLPLTSTSWDGDAYSTTGKTLIDLSAVFGVPAGVKAVLLAGSVNDSGSVGTNCYLLVSPNNTAGQGPVAVAAPRSGADHVGFLPPVVCPCESNGDVYYQIVASGTLTMDVYLFIWGYQY